MKRCVRCHLEKPAEDFRQSPGMRDGLHSYCRECQRAAARESYYRTRGRDVPDGGKTYRRRPSTVASNEKWCPDCGEVKAKDAFPRNRSSKDGVAAYCKPCHNQRGTASKDRVGGSRTHHLMRRYGLTAEDVDAMVEAQGGTCAACRIDEPKHVDHDHETGAVRGILCFRCNVALGNVGDDLARLQGLAAYLLRFQDRIVSVLQLECPRPAVAGVRALLRDETPRWTVASPAG